MLTSSSDAHIKSVSQAYLAQYEPAQEEVEAQPAAEVEPADTSAPVAEEAPVVPEEKTNDETPVTQTNGTTAAAEDAATEGAGELEASQEWVSVPRPTETESSTEESPVAAANGQSWADDHPETPAEVC